jgi:hypothetical protein
MIYTVSSPLQVLRPVAEWRLLPKDRIFVQGTGDPHLDERGEQALSNIDLFLWVSSCGVTQGLEF